MEQRGACAIWTIARPEAKNALDLATINALVSPRRTRGTTARCARSCSRARATRSSPAGTSASSARKRPRRRREAFAAAGSRLCSALEELPVPVLAAMPGAAFGGGAELAVACDLRVADPTARISFKQVRMGVTTAWGTIGRLVALVGSSAAARLLYTAQEVPAPEALAMGLVDAVSAPGECVALALAWAADVALGSPRAGGGDEGAPPRGARRQRERARAGAVRGDVDGRGSRRGDGRVFRAPPGGVADRSAESAEIQGHFAATIPQIVQSGELPLRASSRMRGTSRSERSSGSDFTLRSLTEVVARIGPRTRRRGPRAPAGRDVHPGEPRAGAARVPFVAARARRHQEPREALRFEIPPRTDPG